MPAEYILPLQGTKRLHKIGNKAKNLQGAARGIIDASEHADRFGHGLGHGVGLAQLDERRAQVLQCADRPVGRFRGRSKRTRRVQGDGARRSAQPGTIQRRAAIAL